MASIERRRNADGTISHRAKIRLKGHPDVTASFARKTDAIKWAQSTEAAIREGRYFQHSEAARHTFNDLVDKYLTEVLPHRPKNAANTKRHLNYWAGKLGHFKLSEITPAVLSRVRTELQTEPAKLPRRDGKMVSKDRPRSNGTVLRYLASISHAFNIAMKDWQWVTDNPVAKISKPREARGRERFLSDTERDRLLSVCKASGNAKLYAIVVLAISTGMRRGEILGLRWNDVDLQRRTILLRQTKNDTSRSVPLTGLAYQLIEDLERTRQLDNDFVFAGQAEGKPMDLKKAWDTAVRGASLQNFRFHDLRHTAASYLAMNGATTMEIAAVLGHKTLQMVKRYSHLANSHTAVVVSSMNEKIFGTAKK